MQQSQKEVVDVAQKFDYPKTEYELEKLLDNLYRETKKAVVNKEAPRFKGLIEIIGSEVVILTAIHNIKSNKGSKTEGSDKRSIRPDILEEKYEITIEQIQKALKPYTPDDIKRVYIPKPGKKEKRPLGIPTIKDRIIQGCIRIVIEPIMEAQFNPSIVWFSTNARY